MTRAILVAFHKYQPFGEEFYEPILDFFIKSMKKYEDEYDKIYFIDSNWNISNERISSLKAEVLKVNQHLRYYDAYKEVLPQIKEDLVLFMDNDMVVYRKWIIDEVFQKFTTHDVVSIYDSCGTYKTDKLNGGNKFCPYWFATKKDLLMKYRDVEWGPGMPEHETLGKLTEVMLNDGIKPYEFKEDKNSIYIDGKQNGDGSFNLGYYHIRAGSTIAYLLAERGYGNKETYWAYLKKQPEMEYLRQCAWYCYMCGPTFYPQLLNDLAIDQATWTKYMAYFLSYHGL